MPSGEEGGLTQGVVSLWTGQNGGQPSRFVCGQVGGGFPKVMASCGFRPIHVSSPLRDIEIKFEDPCLGQPLFERAGDQGFAGLAEQRTF